MSKTKITWATITRGHYSAHLGRHSASIVTEHGPLGLYFGASVNGKSIGGSNVLDNAKDMVAEKLKALSANDADAQSVNHELSKLFGKPDPRKGEGSTPEEARRNARLHGLR